MQKNILESLSRLKRIDEELGAESLDSIESDSQSDTFQYSERVIFSDIQDIKNALTDYGIILCSNRRKVIELNAKIYRQLKETLQTFSLLQSQFDNEKDTRWKRKKLSAIEIGLREQSLTVMFAQLKYLQNTAEENHAVERFHETNEDHMQPFLTMLPASPLPYKDDMLDVRDTMQEVEEELTEHQKASLQYYEKNKQDIDQMLDVMIEGLSDLKNDANAMGDEIVRQNGLLTELNNTIDNTTDRIEHDRTNLQRHNSKHSGKNCGMYICCMILILIVVIFILNILRSAFK